MERQDLVNREAMVRARIIEIISEYFKIGAESIKDTDLLYREGLTPKFLSIGDLIGINFRISMLISDKSSLTVKDTIDYVLKHSK